MTPIKGATLALCVGVALMVIKYIAFTLTGSTAILSDAAESVVNVLAGGFAMFSVWLSAKAPDKNHPYGHGRVEHFSAAFEGFLVLLAAGSIIYYAAPKIFFPTALHEHVPLGISIVAVAGIVNGLLGIYLKYLGRVEMSPTLIADGKHLISDAITSGGILLGVLIVALTEFYVYDAVIAVGVGIWIMVIGFKLVKESISHLMNEANLETLQRVVETLNKHKKHFWIDIHRLRTWSSGPKLHVDFHIVLPSYWSLKDAHEAEEEIRESIKREHPDADILLHLDPCTFDYCSTCQVGGCEIRESQFHWRPRLTVENAMRDKGSCLQE